MAKLNKELGAKAPTKKQINLIKKEVKTTDVGSRIVLIVAVVAVLLAVGGYTFMRWQTVRGLALKTVQLQDELASMQMISATYQQIDAEYVRYSTAYETAAEKKTQDSRVLIDKARELIEPYGYITGISVKGNMLEITLVSMDTSKVTDSLQNDPDGMVLTVNLLWERKEKDAARGGREAGTGTQETEEPAETGETGETGEAEENPPANDAGVVDPKQLVESTAFYNVVFADREG